MSEQLVTNIIDELSLNDKTFFQSQLILLPLLAIIILSITIILYVMYQSHRISQLSSLIYWFSDQLTMFLIKDLYENLRITLEISVKLFIFHLSYACH